MKGSCDSMPHLANESFLTKEQQDRLKGIFDDFVAVVRCKDCKHYKPYTGRVSGNQYFECECFDMDIDNPDWFCANGRRNEQPDV